MLIIHDNCKLLQNTNGIVDHFISGLGYKQTKALWLEYSPTSTLATYKRQDMKYTPFFNHFIHFKSQKKTLPITYSHSSIRCRITHCIIYYS